MMRLSPHTKQILFLVTLLLLVLHPFAKYTEFGIANRLKFYGVGMLSGFGDDWALLRQSNYGSFTLIDWINRRTPEDSLVLVYRQNEFAYYGARRFIRDVDPRMTGFYRLTDRDEAHRFLVRLGVDYVLLPAEKRATIMNSAMMGILGDPGLSELIREHPQGEQIYRLRPVRRPVRWQDVDAGALRLRSADGTLSWEARDRKSGSGTGRFTEHPDGSFTFTADGEATDNTVIYSGPGPVSHSPRFCFSQDYAIEGAAVHRLSARLKGEGIVSLYLAGYTAEGTSLEWHHLSRVQLSDRVTAVERQFIPPPHIHDYRMLFIPERLAEITVDAFVLARLDDRDVLHASKAGSSWRPLWGDQRASDEAPRGLSAEVHPRNPRRPPAFFHWGAESGNEKGGASVYLEQAHGIRFLDKLPVVPWLRDLSLYRRWSSKEDSWLFTGEEEDVRSPPVFDPRWTGHASRPLRLRISGVIRGEGYADLYVLWYTEAGNAGERHVGSYALPDKDRRFSEIVALPFGADRFRVAFRLSRDRLLRGQPSTLYVNRLHIEKEDANAAVAPRPETGARLLWKFDSADSRGPGAEWSVYRCHLACYPEEETARVSSPDERGRHPLALSRSSDEETWLVLARRFDPGISRGTTTRRHRISAIVKGEGFADLFVEYERSNGSRQWVRLSRFRLPVAYAGIQHTFRLPEDVVAFRAAVSLPRETGKTGQKIIIDDLEIESLQNVR